MNVNGTSTTKAELRADIAYIKNLMRQMEAEIKCNNWDEVADLANDAGACSLSIIDSINIYR